MAHLPIADSMDIAFLLVNKSLIHHSFSAITRFISTVINPFSANRYDIRLALIKTMSDDRSRLAIVHPFTTSVDTFKHCLGTNDPLMGQRTQIGPFLIHEALREALNLDWRSTNSDGCHENVVFLITDDVPCRSLLDPTATFDDHCECACNDLWTISKDFVNRNLTLMIIGVGDIVSICDNLYGGVAKNTGGEYIPFINAARILLRLTKSIIKQGYTMSQSLRHIKQAEFEANSSYNYSLAQEEEQFETKHCPMMARKGEWLLKHSHQVN